MHGKRILLIVGGGIAAYRALDVVRGVRRAGGEVTPVLTRGGAEFVTALSLAALAEAQVHEALFSVTNEAAMGHIALSRSADLIVVCPATADLIARHAAGIADDLATTLLLATDTPVLMVPAMNVRMWDHPATIANIATLRARGVQVIDPDEGVMACGEFGRGRLPPVDAIVAAIAQALAGPQRLAGRHAIVTAGPTHEAIDPVRYLANRSSGKQGYAVAGALAALGCRVTLVSGPVALPTPAGCDRVDVVSARDMAAAVESALPADIAVMVAAVADWRVEAAGAKLKKKGAPPALTLVENPDILAGIAAPGPRRPRLVVGFAAETETTREHAQAKRVRKNADWIVANDVSGDVFGGDANLVHLVTGSGVEDWPPLPKAEVARRLAARIADAL
ncbi:bifunctional phosphopantothenoylcysteine decarboxylase/phosphopantothenate--cysteine ligase CoaBC [Glacieibacterium frigidum]|uniref:Coenzyme A biosynthesis bifunctional protein CoaBC n=1 Tax=Glacieibacterium frigidum TaxID=2593303 RepID=A0A552UFW2_9SPHN|nr:bifunctional phosphopantothenoylcysteine decarboxylase/phosphopantothenate--cysteine ligase CoaBC [Glacieibacterium frigidum]TRW17079.1 bifunctional phosphopantothenoylcysteine decarboxylase/phosphopantothenate--cysteine ligase CoaBC [Glacieibacterium frigidum]